MYYLSKALYFPPVEAAIYDGLLAVGGDLSVERLLLAYRSGIFPWFEYEEPILWWSPNPRFVLFPGELKISKSMKQVLRNSEFEVTMNQDFRKVIASCSEVKRRDQHGTWITNKMIDAYTKLHELGYAKSIEVWLEGKIVGGLYGVDLGNGVFSGESMFSSVSNASKVGFITFVENSNYNLIDCQVHTKHLESLGAKHIPRTAFLKYLK